ncbi:hypothetical protein A2412_01715 [Candidatus Peribacteria bacterium RIFOXYC1_FULL_58_8]|nr:MAG: hypothetical protein A2412_01715 [Candidatus Peribacteria bacterium RIFOXYC1_FULL_58_8]
MRLSQSLQHGQTVQNSVRVVNGNATASEQVNIIRYFPQTGLLERFIKSPADKAAFLQPVTAKKRPAEGDASIPMLTWLILASMGLTTGGFLGKKLIFMGM